MTTSNSSIISVPTTSGRPTILDDVNFHFGSAKFVFPNGDKYEGQYCAHRSGVIWREGNGAYFTNDGQTYSGKWVDDKLVEEKDLEIVFEDGSRYNGPIKNNKYAGSGIYTMENGMTLFCDFEENLPKEKFLMEDITERTWHGEVKTDCAMLYPEHDFYTNLHPSQGKGQPRIVKKKSDVLTVKLETTPPSTKSEKTTSSSRLSCKSAEKVVFAKSTKTEPDNFEESKWYKSYIRFMETHRNIMKKIQKNGVRSLDEDEKKWYYGYERFKEEYVKRMASRTAEKSNLSAFELYEMFHSVEYRNSFPPVKVFYPKSDNKPCDCEPREPCLCPLAQRILRQEDAGSDLV